MRLLTDSGTSKKFMVDHISVQYSTPGSFIEGPNPDSQVALDWLDFSPGLKNMAVTLLVFRHVQGDLCVGLTVEDESGSEGEISQKFLIHDSSF